MSRIIDFKEKLLTILNDLNIAYSDNHLNNKREILSALANLSEYCIFDDYIHIINEKAKKCITPKSEESNIFLFGNVVDLKEFISAINDLNSVIRAIINTINMFYKDDIADQINIKIPDNITLSQASDMIDDFDFIFNKCAVINELNNKDEASILKVDSGSIWIILGVSTNVLTFVGGIIGIALNMRKELINQQISMQQFSVYKSTAKLVEELGKVVEEQVKENYRKKRNNLSKKIILKQITRK